jgi:trehalose synthase
MATDDLEGEEIYESLLGYREERTIILTAQDVALMNTLQRRAGRQRNQ